jgi:hypothetical protein
VTIPTGGGSGWDSVLTWNLEFGKVIIELLGDLQGQSDYKFSFTVRNGPLKQDAKYVYLGDNGVMESNTATESTTMYISSVEFTVRNIAQSSPYPCALNTISVTLETNVGLLKTCGNANGIGNGVYPKITISGLIGSRDSIASRLASSTSSPFNNSVTALSSGQLVFSPVLDVVGNTQYAFVFTLTNQETGQSASANMAIDIDILTHEDTEYMLTPSDRLKPMYIMDPIVKGDSATTVGQQSSYPCAQNTISVSITTNVPVFEKCSPILTLTGLTASSTTDVGASALIALSGTMSAPNILSIVSWTRQTGTLVLDLNTIDPDSTVTGNDEGTTVFWFTVILRNPSKYQNAPGVDLQLKYSAEWRNLATGHGGAGSKFSVAVSGGGVFNSADDKYPFKISLLTVTSRFAQSSPYPCDNNTITVTFTPSLHLVPRCSPSLTVSGLTGSDTASTNALSVSYTNGGSAMAGKLAQWNSADGSLVWSIFAASDELPIVSAGTDVVFTFTLRNRALEQSSPLSTLSITLQDRPTNINGYLQSFHTATTHSSTLVVPGANAGAVVTAGKDQCSARPANGDADPLFIRAVTITTFSVVQSTANPCADNLITVSLTTDGPLFPRCVSALTLAGFAGSVTPNGTSLGLTIAPPGAMQTSGAWSTFAGGFGRLVVPAMTGGVLVGCQGYEIRFTLKNPAAPQSAAAVTLRMSSVIVEKAGSIANTNLDPMKVVGLTWASKVVSDTSLFPCHDNVITLTLTPDIRLYAACVRYLVFTGFVGSMTAGDRISITDMSTSATFNTSSAWNMSSGTLRVHLVADMLASTQYKIQFTLRNGKIAQGPQSISIEAPLLYNGNKAAMTGTEIMNIVDPSWNVAISTSSSNPCKDSTVSITITPRVAPIRLNCDAKLTIRGIRGSATTSTEVSGTVGSNGGLLAVAVWAYAEGNLFLTLTSDLQHDTVYTYAFTVENQPTENSAQSVTFQNPSTFALSVANTVVSSGDIMKINPLIITAASARQSIHWPCATNVITVSFTTSIELLGGCQHGETFAQSRSTPPKITLSGLTGTRLGEDIGQTTSLTASLHQRQPSFTQGDGGFILTPAGSLAMAAHAFSFAVVNQETGNSAATLSINTEWVTSSWTSVDVGSTDRTQPMYILAPRTLDTTTVHQSSDNPCAVNTITVSLNANVPMYVRCTPSITFTGLTGSSSDSASDITALALDYSGAHDVTLDSWSRTSGTLILEANNDLPSGDTLLTSFLFKISFNIINPSQYQQLPGMNVEINYHGSDSTKNTFANDAQVTVRTGVMGIAHANLNNHQYYPLQIRDALVTSSISQTSPWPCDANTISVEAAIDIILYPR